MTEEEAIPFIKDNKKLLLAEFAEPIESVKEDPTVIFMAGSSGAGKTETAKSFMQKLPPKSTLRIDADDIKDWIQEKCGGDVNDYHRASALGVEKLYDYCMSKKKNCILDGTFVSLEKGQKNINTALKKGFQVFIAYVYQPPHIAWKFVQERAKLMGRNVPYDVFKKTFLQSIENVYAVKKEFKRDVVAYMIEKNFENNFEKQYINVSEGDLNVLRQKVIMEYSKI